MLKQEATSRKIAFEEAIVPFKGLQCLVPRWFSWSPEDQYSLPIFVTAGCRKIIKIKSLNFARPQAPLRGRFNENKTNDLGQKDLASQGSGLYTDPLREPSTLNGVGLKPNWRASPPYLLPSEFFYHDRLDDAYILGDHQPLPIKEFSLNKPKQRLSRVIIFLVFQHLNKVSVTDCAFVPQQPVKKHNAGQSAFEEGGFSWQCSYKIHCPLKRLFLNIMPHADSKPMQWNRTFEE